MMGSFIKHGKTRMPGTVDAVFRYIWLQLKRTAAHIRSFLITVLILLGCMVFLVLLLNRKGLSASESGVERVCVGIVRDPEDSFMSMALRLVEGMESVSKEVELRDMSEAQAREALETGEAAAYLVVPTGFIQSVMYGENLKILCVTGGSNAGLISMIMDSLMEAMSRMLLESQNAVYGMQNALTTAGSADTIEEDIDRLNLAYFNLISDRSKLFAVRTGAYRRGLTAAGYYFCSLTLLFMLLVPLGGMKAFVCRDLSFERILRRRGIGAAGQITAEYISCLLLTMVNTGVLMFLFLIMARRGIFFDGIRQLSDAASLARLILSMTPAFILTSAVHSLIFSCAGNAVDCVLTEVLYTLVSSYSCGCMYPASFLPMPVRRFGSLLPTGRVFSFLQGLLAGGTAAVSALQLLLYAAVLLAAAAAMRQYRLIYES